MSAELLAELAERELALAREGRFDLLEPLQERARELVATLPAHPSTPAESEALRRAQRLREQLTAELLAARERALAELRRLDGTRTGLRAYARSAASSSVDPWRGAIA